MPTNFLFATGDPDALPMGMSGRRYAGIVHEGREYTVRSTWSGGVVCTLAGLITARSAEDMVSLSWARYNAGIGS